MTLNLSDKLEIGPDTTQDQYSYGGIAQVSDDIAIAVWYANDAGMDSAGNPPAIPVGAWARAIRWTPDGPEVGPLTPITLTNGLVIQAVRSGKAGEVWVLAVNSSSSDPNYTYGVLFIGTLTIGSAATLTVKQSWMTSPYAVGGAYADFATEVWPEENLVILANNGYGTSSTYELAMLSTLDGSVVATVATPAVVGDLCLHKASQKLAVIGLTGTDAFLAFRVSDVTPSSISAPADFYLFDDPYSNYLGAVYATAIPDGWAFIYMPQWPNGIAHVVVHLDGTYQNNGWIFPSALAQGGYYRRTNVLNLIYDATADETRSIEVYSNYFGNTTVTEVLTTEYLDDGASHVDDTLPNSKLQMPLQPGNWAVHTADLCQVGPERFLFFVSGSVGPIIDYSSQYSNYIQAVWAGGPEVVPAPVLGTGGQEDGRTSFRRNR